MYRPSKVSHFFNYKFGAQPLSSQHKEYLLDTLGLRTFFDVVTIRKQIMKQTHQLLA